MVVGLRLVKCVSTLLWQILQLYHTHSFRHLDPSFHGIPGLITALKFLALGILNPSSIDFWAYHAWLYLNSLSHCRLYGTLEESTRIINAKRMRWKISKFSCCQFAKCSGIELNVPNLMEMKHILFSNNLKTNCGLSL